MISVKNCVRKENRGCEEQSQGGVEQKASVQSDAANLAVVLRTQLPQLGRSQPHKGPTHRHAQQKTCENS